MNEKVVREQIKNLLTKSQAHMELKDGVKNFPESAMNTVFPNGTYTPWHLLEHIRRTQHDILDFMINPHYTELEWPKDYWPNPKEEATKETWETTLHEYFHDLDELVKRVTDPHMNLTEKIPHGQGQTYLRELLLLADHTSYHTGEFTIMRQIMNNWEK